MALDNGTVIRETANVDADVCLRNVALDLTLCYAKGTPRIDPVTGEVVGHEMVLTVLNSGG